MRKKNQITQVELFKEFDQIQQKIVNKSKEAQSMGFSSDREFAVYKTLETTLDDAKGITGQIFDGIQEELSITDWQGKGEVKKSMRKNIKEVLRGKVEAKDIQSITVSLVDLIKRN
jgi:type I restriction enzyme R subunit